MPGERAPTPTTIPDSAATPVAPTHLGRTRAVPTVDDPANRVLTRPFVLLCTFAFFNALAFQMLIPVIPLYLIYRGGAEWQAGFVMGSAALAALAVRPAVGYFADNVGRVPLLRFAAAIYLVMAAAYPLARSVATLMVVRVIHGFGLSAQSTGASTYAADIAPPLRRAEAMGLFGSSMNVATAIGPLLGVWMAKSYSYNLVWLLCGVASAAALVVALAMRDHVTPARRARSADTGHVATAPRVSGVGRFFSRDALYPSILGFFFTASFGAILSFLPVLTDHRGIGNPGWFFLPYAVTIVVTRVVAGRAADHWGRSTVLVPGMAALVIGMLVLAFGTSLSALFVAAAMYGVGFGTVHPTLMALVADRAAPGRLGVAMSTFSAAFDLGIGGGSLLWGGLVAFTDERGAFYGGAVAAAIGLAIVIVRLGPDRRTEARERAALAAQASASV